MNVQLFLAYDHLWLGIDKLDKFSVHRKSFHSHSIELNFDVTVTDQSGGPGGRARAPWRWLQGGRGVRIAIFTETRHLIEALITILSIL